MAALTTSALITLILTHTEEVGATDAENTTLRARYLARAQEIVDRIWAYADWDFKKLSAPGTVSMTSTGVADLPADFGDFGDDGKVTVLNQKRELGWLEPRALIALKELEGATATYPDYFTVSGYTTSNGQRNIIVYPTPTGTITLNVWYNKIAPTLADATDSTSGLQSLPPQFHYTVMVTGLQFKAAIDKGDGRAQDFERWFDQEMRAMKSRHVFGREQAQVRGQYGGVSAFRSW